MRFLRGKLEVAASEDNADEEKASHKQVSGTRYQVLGKEVFSYHFSVRASFSLCELDLHNQHRKDVKLIQERWTIELELRRN